MADGARPSRWLVAWVALLVGACEPTTRPVDQPGPEGCGLADPAITAPTRLSAAQQLVLRKQGPPHRTRANRRGGLDWLYRRAAGKPFEQRQVFEVFTFQRDGLLVGQKTEARYKEPRPSGSPSSPPPAEPAPE